MTAYFDSSAIVPLLVLEPGTPRCTRAWNAAPEVACVSLTYVEVHTALAQAQRQGRLSEESHRRAAAAFEQLWEQVTVITPSEALIRHAASLGVAHALRGYDAVHCAAALAIADDELFAVSGDRALVRAWSEQGVITVDTNA